MHLHPSIYNKRATFLLDLILHKKPGEGDKDTFINFIPAAFVLDRGGNLFFSPLIVFSTPVIGVLFMLAGAQLWRQGLRVYESAGN